MIRLVTLSQPTLAVVGLSQLEIGMFLDDMQSRSGAVPIVRSDKLFVPLSEYDFNSNASGNDDFE